MDNELKRARLGVDGNAGFALVGENIQEGEAEFVTVPPEDGIRNQRQREAWAATQAYRKLQARLPYPISYFLDESHPNFC